MKNYGKFTAWLIAGWFLFALTASALHVFENGANRIGLAVAIAALTPIVVFLWRGSLQIALIAAPSSCGNCLALQTWRLR